MQYDLKINFSSFGDFEGESKIIEIVTDCAFFTAPLDMQSIKTRKSSLHPIGNSFLRGIFS